MSVREHISKTKEIIDGTLQLGGVVEQTAFVSVTQNQEKTITHNEDASLKRVIQVLEYEQGQNIINTTLDFDLADEAQFTQEDSVNGTTFVGGKVQGAVFGGLYSLSAPVSSGQYLVNQAATTLMKGFCFNSTGIHLYVIGYSDCAIYQYQLATPWDITTASFIRSRPILTTQELYGYSVQINTSGTNLYLIGPDKDRIMQMKMSTAFNIGSVSTTPVLDVSAQDSVPTGLYVSPDEKNFFIIGQTTDCIYRYYATTAGDLTTASYSQTFSTSGYFASPRSIEFSTDGFKFFIAGADNGIVHAFNCSPAFNIGTPSYVGSYDCGFPLSEVRFDSAGSKMYTIGNGSDKTIFSYNLKRIPSAASYVVTSDDNHIPLIAVENINSCSITYGEPASTYIKGLVSFDGRQTWSKWDGNSWVNIGALSLSSFDFENNANTVPEIESGLTNLAITDESFVDFVFDLDATEGLNNPYLDGISLDYNEVGSYRAAKLETEYKAAFLSSTQTLVKKISAGTNNIKVNILI